ncbi:MAG: hypothetical protein JKY27_03605 [Magnetovibrio sp.]|nr:hypothetical protein [Magnetovibrio sp.]
MEFIFEIVLWLFWPKGKDAFGKTAILSFWVLLFVATALAFTNQYIPAIGFVVAAIFAFFLASRHSKSEQS